MTIRDDFTMQEWVVLGNAPLAAAAAVALAEPGGGSREAAAIIAAWREAEELFVDNRLVQMLVRDFDPEQPRITAQPPTNARATIDEEAIFLCQRSTEMLAARASKDDQEAYRSFVLHIATRVAEAEGGGLLGFGGVAVTLNEQSALRSIRIALEPLDDPLG